MFGYTGTYKGHQPVMGTRDGECHLFRFARKHRRLRCEEIDSWNRRFLNGRGSCSWISFGAGGAANQLKHRSYDWPPAMISSKLLALICLIKPTISPKNLVWLITAGERHLMSFTQLILKRISSLVNGESYCGNGSSSSLLSVAQYHVDALAIMTTW